MKFEFEELTRENIDCVRKIDREEIPVNYVHPVDRILEITEQSAAHGCAGHTFAVKSGGQYVGVILLGETLPWPTDPPEMSERPFYRLMGFLIDKRYRGLGLGGAVLEQAIERVYEDFGVRPIALCCHMDNRSAARFYTKHGFCKTEYRETDDYYYLRYPEPTDAPEEPALTSYQDRNAETIDRWVKEGWEWGVPIDRETFAAAKRGQWDVLLTPTKFVPHAWFGPLKGKMILGLASGGGQQMPVFAACGAICTVLDYSEEQLSRERLVAQREHYDIEIVRADMTKPLPFPDESFDLIFHPVSNCYVEEVEPIWRECWRVLKPGGVLLSGMDNGVNYLFADDRETEVVNSLPFNPLKNPEQMRQLEEDDCGVQFSHTLDEQLGGQLRAGFRLTDLYEDVNAEGRLHDLNIPCFVAARAVKEA